MTGRAVDVKAATSARTTALLAALAAIVAAAVVQPRVAQDPAYHLFADQRAVFGVANGGDVWSNLGFAIAGALGLAVVFGSRRRFDHPAERWPYAALFAGTLLTAIGSAYYHLAPDNGRLVWDRLPMTVGFMGLVAAVVAERVSLSASRRLLVPLLTIGAASVWYWHWTEAAGAGDLRFYGVVQFGSLLLVVLMLALFPSRYGGTAFFWIALAIYATAKLFELLDRQIFAAGQIVSGHTLKHVAAAAAIGCVVAMLTQRGRP